MVAKKQRRTKENSSNNLAKSDQVESGTIIRNAQKVHSYPKGDLRHWLDRVRKVDSPDYSIQIAHGKARHRFPLGTPLKDAAAKKALEIYQMLRSSGWEVTLAKHKQKPVVPVMGSTVGELLAAVTELANVRPTTLRGYCATFRRIVADVEGIEAQKGRYASAGKGRDAWLKAVDAIPLARLTPDRLEAWKLEYVRQRAGKNALRQRAAKNSANSLLRMGKGLFAKRLMRLLKNRITLPSPLPFEGVDLFPRQSMRYDSKMNVEDLLKAAAEKLPDEDPEALKAFVLCLFAGLRRNEADKLRWSSVNFEAGVIRVETQSDFAPKAETSLDDVPVDPEAISILRDLRAKEPEAEYVLKADAPKRKFKLPRPPTQESLGKLKWAKYRANDTFVRLTTWLRKNGVKERTPLHTLRKEAGSLVAKNHGLIEASRFLRHADVAITAQHYISMKKRVTVGLGSLLASEEKTP